MSGGVPESSSARRLDDAIAEYLHAVDIGQPVDREAFLQKHADIRSELEECLNVVNALDRVSHAPASDDRTRAGVGSTGDPKVDAAQAETLLSPGPSRSIPSGVKVRYFGDYLIRSELGRGGMGVVYRAHQISLNRPVALKMIRAGVLADGAELQRFQNEAEAVALLDHPSIVPVYEVGDHEGQHYFSMKLIEGSNLAERAKLFPSRPREAAKLLVKLAEAVHHAHTRGILHRDLKPANILLDSEESPHITDFGLAKRLESQSEITATGDIVGTPSYMSPEQASGRRGSITMATDVYGLGAILYTMLTGRAPFQGDSIVDTLTKVKEQPPSAPSQLNSKVPRDLETICLKCLEKDPRRRYASALLLAEDVKAWLDTRPITARRVGAMERTWLWCLRKPAVATLTAATTLAIAAGIVTVIFVQAVANTRLRATNARLDQQRKRAEASEEQAVAAVGRFTEAIVKEPELKKTPALSELRKRLLKEPLVFFDNLRARLQNTTDTQPEVLSRLAKSTYEHAYLTSEISDKRDALRSYQDTAQVYEQLVKRSPQNAELRSYLGRTLRSLGLVHAAMGHAQESLNALTRSREICEALVRSNPGNAEFQNELATVYDVIGNHDRERGDPRRALELHTLSRKILERLVQERPNDVGLQADLAVCYDSIGLSERQIGHLPEALSSFTRAAEIEDDIASRSPDIAAVQRKAALSHGFIGVVQEDLGKYDLALASMEKARDALARLTRENPSVNVFQNDLAGIHNNISTIQQKLGNADGALASLGEAQKIFERLVQANPGVIEYESNQARCLHNIGQILRHTDEPEKALENFNRARAIRARLAAENPTLTACQVDLAQTCSSLGNLLRETDRPDEAMACYLEAQKLQERLVRDFPESPDRASEMGAIFNNMAMLDLDESRFDAARDRLRLAILWQEKALAINPKNAMYSLFLGNHYRNLLKAARGLDDASLITEAEQRLTELKTHKPGEVDH